MNNPKIDLNKNKIRNPKGLKSVGEIDLECRQCKTTLLCLQLVTDDEEQDAQVLTRVAVKCGLCDGYSEVIQVEGRFYPGAPSDKMIFDIANDENEPIDADVLFKAWNK